MGKDRNPGTGDAGARNAAERQAQADFDRNATQPSAVPEIVQAQRDAQRLGEKHGLKGKK